MQESRESYQKLVSIFNRHYKNYFREQDIDYLELEIWYQIYLRAKQSKSVIEDDLIEMANVLYNTKDNLEKHYKVKRI